MPEKKIDTILLDGYLDEPSCLGVPPYISPHIRYLYGALLDAKIPEKNIKYITIDQLRKDKDNYLNMIEKKDLFIVIAGTTVPGNYLQAKPISIKEIKELGKTLYYPTKVLGGPITLIKKKMAGYDFLTKETAALDIYSKLMDIDLDQLKNDSAQYIAKWAEMGAKLTVKHPFFPNLVNEIETFRGCPRKEHCAFCSERLKKLHYKRTPEQIISEIRNLSNLGNHYYRLGCQTDILSYSTDNKGKLNTYQIEKLYSGIRKADPKLKVLHLDNINPATIANNINQSKKILKIITKYNTEGDTAAFGLESADPHVLKKNNIETNPEKTLKAIELINQIGSYRVNGVPKLLPGINFLHGLIGERDKTYEYNYKFLKEVYDRGLILRRINIRQVVNINNYPSSKIKKSSFNKYKDLINKEINKPMLKRVFPTNTILRNILIEKVKGKLSYGRQLGTYPILVAIPGKLKVGKFYNAKVIDHGYRSITALPWPIKISQLNKDQLSFIPGIGDKRANKIFLSKPTSVNEISKIIKDTNTISLVKEIFSTEDRDQ
ncbi:MAG: radical SAM protein [Halanaerobiales bacterium]|nr:radical SAM protein [Halanaerobiales bacterium]